MAITLTNADNALKTYYLDAVSSQLDQYINPFYAAIQKTTNDVWGKEIRKLAISGVNGGIGAGTEDGSLPNAVGNDYVQLVSTLKNLYGVIEISDKAIRASENNAGAFVSLLNTEMQSLIKSSAFNFGRMLFGDGNGRLAAIRTMEEGVISIDTPNNIVEGMMIEICDSEGIPVEGIGPRRVVSVNREEKTVKVSGETIDDQLIPTYSYLVMQGSYGKELTGLGAIFSTRQNTIYGADKTSHAILNPFIYPLNNNISENDIQYALDKIEVRSGNKVNFIICSLGVRRALLNLFNSRKMYINTVELEGGYQAINFNGIPIVADRFCPDGTMYLLNTNDFTLNQLCDWQWLTGDDGKVLHQIPGKPVYTATLVKYADLICSCPAGQGVITGINEF